jgi:uncharacterized DUF497 family protein
MPNLKPSQDVQPLSAFRANLRIISVRKATPSERRQYESGS